MNGLLERTFHLSKNHTNVKTEVLAGITTFMTMAYILAVNPSILSSAEWTAARYLRQRQLASCLATLMMAAFSNYPFALAPGMGLNAFFAYTVVGQMGFTWHVGTGSGICGRVIFIVLS